MKNIIGGLLAFVTLIFALPANVNAAVCGVCTVAVLTGVGLSRWLGIDDTISGLWIGAMLIAVISLTISWLKKLKISFKGISFIVAGIFYASVLIPLYIKDIIGHPKNVIWGIDKLLFGMIVGTVVFCLGLFAHYLLRDKNNGKVYFPFQKVIIPISPVLIFTLLFWLVTR